MTREIEIKEDKIKLEDAVETFFEKEVKSLGNSGRVNVPKKYIGNRAYVIVLKD